MVLLGLPLVRAFLLYHRSGHSIPTTAPVLMGKPHPLGCSLQRPRTRRLADCGLVASSEAEASRHNVKFLKLKRRGVPMPSAGVGLGAPGARELEVFYGWVRFRPRRSWILSSVKFCGFTSCLPMESSKQGPLVNKVGGGWLLSESRRKREGETLRFRMVCGIDCNLTHLSRANLLTVWVLTCRKSVKVPKGEPLICRYFEQASQGPSHQPSLRADFLKLR